MKLIFGASTLAVATFFVGCKDDKNDGGGGGSGDDGKCQIVGSVSNSTITCPDGYACADSSISGIKYCKDNNAKACTGNIASSNCTDGFTCWNNYCVDTNCDPTCGTNEMCVDPVNNQCVDMGKNDVTSCTKDEDCAANTVYKKCLVVPGQPQGSCFLEGLLA